MNHTVEKYFRREREKAFQSWRLERPNVIECDIGLEAHVKRKMPLFLTLRDSEGNPLTTAMLLPGGDDRAGFSNMKAKEVGCICVAQTFGRSDVRARAVAKQRSGSRLLRNRR